MALLWCLHITDPATYTMDKNDPRYDKMHQTRGLINRIWDSYQKEWNLGHFITIDETMIRYIRINIVLLGNISQKTYKVGAQGLVCYRCHIKICL